MNWITVTLAVVGGIVAFFIVVKIITSLSDEISVFDRISDAIDKFLECCKFWE